MRIMAIDPGSSESAFVTMDVEDITSFGKITNYELLMKLRSSRDYHVVLERIASYGMPVGEEVFTTCIWTGKFMEAAQCCMTQLIYRREVKIALCGSMKANDAAIRQRIIDIYGGKEKAIGLKKTPGKLYGIKADIWQALALALTYKAGVTGTDV